MFYSSHLLKNNKNVWFLPTLTLALIFISHLLFRSYASYLAVLFPVTPLVFSIENCIYLISLVVGEYWLCVRIYNTCFYYLKSNDIFQKYSTLSIVLPFFNALFKALTFLILFNFLSQHLELPVDVSYTLNKLSSVLIICAISWLLFKIIDIAEQLLLNHFSAEVSGITTERKVYTQTLILKRVAYFIVTILTAGAILVLFDNVRALGASVLTTAGVVGIILTFTAQRSLTSIFSGLEIALTQPIKIGDSVVIDNEGGIIEEINFRNVIVKLWDWRRLVVPTSFFLDKSFQNWSRESSANLLGTIYLYVDFTLPVDDVRKHLTLILSRTAYWDKNVGLLQVGDLQERVMQLKILASAHNPDDLSNLRALIREEIMHYIVKKYPYALPKTRSYTVKNDFDKDVQSEKIYKEIYS